MASGEAPPGLIDAHCHFARPEFDSRREALLDQAARAGIRALVMPATRREDWPLLASLASQFSALYYAPGLHPWWAEQHRQEDFQALEQWLEQRDSRLLAIGECGLDRLKGDSTKQRPWFEGQVQLAREHRLPLLIHSVRTHEAVLSVLKAERFTGPALLHGFAGSYEQARQLVDQGLYLGVTGLITHPRARKTCDALSRAPLEALVLETDAPDMPLAGMAKGENSPLALTRILECLCELRSEPREQLVHQIGQNTERLFGKSFAVGVHSSE